MSICNDTTFEGHIKYILTSLPETLIVYPTENYYYFIIPYCGKILKGNLKFDLFYDTLSQKVRIVYDFYSNISLDFESDTFEYKEWVVNVRLTDDSNVTVLFNIGDTLIRKFVIFPEVPSSKIRVPESSDFIFNTIDESGLVFSLTYDTTIKSFIWFLSDTQIINFKLIKYKGPIYFEPVSGFVFIKIKKGFILIGVPLLNVVENNWWDGPFDQLNDRNWNLKIYNYMLMSYPYLDTVIDKYLYKKSGNGRVAPANYLQYYHLSEIFERLRKLMNEQGNKCKDYNLERSTYVSYECLKEIWKRLF